MPEREAAGWRGILFPLGSFRSRNVGHLRSSPYHRGLRESGADGMPALECEPAPRLPSSEYAPGHSLLQGKITPKGFAANPDVVYDIFAAQSQPACCSRRQEPTREVRALASLTRALSRSGSCRTVSY